MAQGTDGGSVLARKLGVRPDSAVLVLSAPAVIADLLQPLPPQAELISPEAAHPHSADVVLLFAADSAALDDGAADAIAAARPGGLLWIAYPKGGRKAGTDLNRDLLWQHMQRYDLAGVTLVAVDATWSAMRFRPSAEVGT